MFSKLSFLYKYRRALATLLLLAVVLGTFVSYSLFIYKTGVNNGKLASQAEHDAFIQQTLKAQIHSNNHVLKQYKAQQKQYTNIAQRYVRQTQAQHAKIKQLTGSFNEYINSRNWDNCQLDARGLRLINELIHAANTTSTEPQH